MHRVRSPRKPEVTRVAGEGTKKIEVHGVLAPRKVEILCQHQKNKTNKKKMIGQYRKQSQF